MTWTYILVTIHPSFVMTSHLIDNCGVFLTNSSKQSLCFSGANIMVLKCDCAVHKCIFRVDLKFTKMLRRQRFALDPNGRADNDYASGYFPGFRRLKPDTICSVNNLPWPQLCTVHGLTTPAAQVCMSDHRLAFS
jgi:hypothetical protein